MRLGILHMFGNTGEKVSDQMSKIKCSNKISAKTTTNDCTSEDMLQKGMMQPFQKALSKIIESNINAEALTRTSLHNSAFTNNEIKHDESDNTEADLNILQDGTIIGVLDMEIEGVIPVDADQSEQVVEILTESFAILSDVLGIKIQVPEAFSFGTITSEAKEHFAEVISILKTMIKDIKLCNEQGLPVEIPGKDPQSIDAAALTDKLNTVVFRIEVACSVLGISNAVQHTVAEEIDGRTNSGIIQATNPQQVYMLPQHVERLFGKLLSDKKQSILQDDAVISGTIKKILSRLNDSSNTMNGFVVKNNAETEQKNENGYFGSNVYRALLKIDTDKLVGDENQSAEESGGKFLTGKDQIMIASGIPDTAGTDEHFPAGSDVVQQVSPSVASPQNTVPEVLLKMGDETVIEQIIEKLQSAMRSGANEVRIQLRPESLGEVRMRIRMEGEIVLARIEVQNQQVKEIMERNFGALKDALAQHNITAGSFDVSIDDNSSGSQHNHSSGERWFDEENKYTAQNDNSHEEKEQHNEQQDVLQSKTHGQHGTNSIEYYG